MSTPSPLLEALDELGAVLQAADHLLLLLDFGGTLAPIAEAQRLAELPAPTRAILRRLARRPECTIGVVSGRAVDDVRARIGIEGLVYGRERGRPVA
jgi:trehalose-phosphatase